MSKSEENGRTTIQDENFECLYNHINELSYYTQQGRRLYDALIKIWQTEDATEQIVSIIRRSLDTNDAMGKLTEKFNVAKFVAKYILDLPLSELTSITLEDLEHKHSYYSKAEESIGVLEDMHDELENNKDNEDNSDNCGMCMDDGVDIDRRVKSVKSDKSVFNTFPFSEIKNIGLL